MDSSLGESVSTLGPTLPVAEDSALQDRDPTALTGVQVQWPRSAQDSGPGSADWVPPESGTFRVRGVAYVAGKTQGGLSVLAHRDGAAGPEASAATLTDGSFSIDIPGPSADSWSLTFDGPGVFPKEVPLGPLVREDTKLGRVLIETGTPFSGKLLREDGQSVPGSWIRAAARDTRSLGSLAGTVDPDGNFFLPKVPPGGRIFAGAPEHRVTRSDQRQLSAALEKDPGNPVTLVLQPGKRIDIGVFDETGNALAGAEVQLQPEDRYSRIHPGQLSFDAAARRPEVLSATTDETGYAHFDTLEDEAYFARARCAGYLPYLGERIELGDYSGQVLTLRRAAEAWLSIHAIDPADGSEFVPKGLRVGLLSAHQRKWIDARPTSDGLVRLELPDTELWTYEAWAPGFRLQAGRTIDPASPTAPPQLVRLLQVPTDRLRITDDRGVLQEDAHLWGSIASRARTQANLPNAELWKAIGRQLEPGIYELPRPGDAEEPTWTAEAPGLLPTTWGRLEWPPKTGTTAEGRTILELPLKKAASLEIRVVDEAGEPVSRASVYLTIAGKGTAFPAITGADGRRLLEGLAPGRVELKARGPAGRISKSVEVDLVGGNHHEAVLEL
ncbi:MAG: carboxypeptidase regulatory-like domain-containing protein [Planctomycetes bacterium]|nr:carboxypeptidase regulatory-like domain-containing protein [Planctomycetota bacterium]